MGDANASNELLKEWYVEREITGLVVDEKKRIVYVGMFDKELPIHKFNFAGQSRGYLKGKPSFWAPRLAFDTRRGLLLAVPLTTIRAFTRDDKEIANIRCSAFRKLDDVSYDRRQDMYIVVDKEAKSVMFISPQTQSVMRTIIIDDVREMLPENNQVCVAGDHFGLSPYLAVTDARCPSIRIYDDGGKLVKHYTKEGDKRGEFNTPMGVCFSAKGQIIVSDSFNDRLVCLSENGAANWRLLVDTNSHKLWYPRAVDITQDGVVAVAFWSIEHGPFRVALFNCASLAKQEAL